MENPELPYVGLIDPSAPPELYAALGGEKPLFIVKSHFKGTSVKAGCLILSIIVFLLGFLILPLLLVGFLAFIASYQQMFKKYEDLWYVGTKKNLIKFSGKILEAKNWAKFREDIKLIGKTKKGSLMLKGRTENLLYFIPSIANPEQIKILCQDLISKNKHSP